MASITTIVNTDEVTWQNKFYESIFGSSYLEDGVLHLDRNTDGYTRGIFFEHKQNVRNYGESKALSQALIYLTRFNRDGIPVPALICLVSQDEQKCYIYKTETYKNYVYNIEAYANLKASDGIPGFCAGVRERAIDFDISSAVGMQEMLLFVQQPQEVIKVNINKHNVYGWSQFYYDNAKNYKQKPEKKIFFEELRNPQKTLKEFINPWNGEEADFALIMDLLNDPMTQKKLGAFYTPLKYADKAIELLKQAIERVPEGNDYIILDRCAGTGNLETQLDDDILSHVIVSTYELKEWLVLADRLGNRVRYIIPRIDDSKVHPDLNQEGFLCGANALTHDILGNQEVMKWVREEYEDKNGECHSLLDDPKYQGQNGHCSIIMFENPPYIETTGIEFQKKKVGKEASDWKKSYVVQEMKKEVSGTASNDMGNVFIWSAFKYFLRQSTDSYVIFSPVKYWKAQHLIDKRFINGFAFNRKHFHAPTPACIMCALWSNEDDFDTDTIEIRAINISDTNDCVDEGLVSVKRIHSLISEKYYDYRPVNEVDIGDCLGLDGLPSMNKSRTKPINDDSVIGYMDVHSSGFDNNRLNSSFLITSGYRGNGFYVRNDNYLEKMPLFAASRYTDHCNNWKVMSMVMKSGDGAERYIKDVKDGKLDVFLHKCLFWVCVSHYPHMRSLMGSDGRLYKNQLCLDGDTIANQELQKFFEDNAFGNYTPSALYLEICEKMNALLNEVHGFEEYNPNFTYGLYQIDEEINTKVQSEDKPIKDDGTPNMVYKHGGDFNNKVKELIRLAKQYYIENLVDTLFVYEFLK